MSYTYEVYQVLKERFVAGQELNLGSLETFFPVIKSDPVERSRFSGALSGLVYHGALERTDKKASRGRRIYKIVDLTLDWRDMHRPLGLTYKGRKRRSPPAEEPVPQQAVASKSELQELLLAARMTLDAASTVLETLEKALEK